MLVDPNHLLYMFYTSGLFRGFRSPIIEALE